MKKQSVFFRWPALCILLLATASSMSCMTTYDSAGRPVQTVDPGLAVAGAAAAGLVGYAIANNRDDNHYYHGHGGYYRPRRAYYRHY
jgi:hypothetical protein